MAWVIKLSVLLAVLIRTIHTDLVIRTEGDYYDIYIGRKADYCLVSIFSDNGNLSPWNFSILLDYSTLTAEIKDRLDIKEFNTYSKLSIKGLNHSDSGQYTAECWRNDSMYLVSRDLLVCGAEEDKNLFKNQGDTVELQCEGKRDGDDMTVRWLLCVPRCEYMEFENRSSLIVIVNEDNMYSRYICVLLKGKKCVSKQEYRLYHLIHYVGLSVGGEAVLSCFNHDDPKGTETQWYYSGNDVYKFSQDSNQLTGRRNQTYVSDGRISGNFSLVIPSLILGHSGGYHCYRKLSNWIFFKSYELLVCPKSEPITEYFSVGEEVVLSCNSGLTESDRVVWYRQTDQVGDAILDTDYNPLTYPDDVEGRINASAPSSFVVLSNLSLADIGEYWCALFSKTVCVSLTKTVLVEWDPFGINSTFYRVYSSLMVCALLVMVCVVITVNLKTRRRDQEERPGGETRRRDQASLKNRRRDQEKRPGFPEDQETEEQQSGGVKKEERSERS